VDTVLNCEFRRTSRFQHMQRAYVQVLGHLSSRGKILTTRARTWDSSEIVMTDVYYVRGQTYTLKISMESISSFSRHLPHSIMRYNSAHSFHLTTHQGPAWLAGFLGKPPFKFPSRNSGRRSTWFLVIFMSCVFYLPHFRRRTPI
jgi:hypothetical protein